MLVRYLTRVFYSIELPYLSLQIQIKFLNSKAFIVSTGFQFLKLIDLLCATTIIDGCLLHV